MASEPPPERAPVPFAFPDPAGQSLTLAAIGYADAGISVFPLEPRGKRPINCDDCGLSNGFKHATTDVETVGVWWDHHADGNIAAVPGYFGLVAFDLDGLDQMQVFRAELAASNVPEVNTAVVISGREEAGAHVYYAATSDTPEVSSALVTMGNHRITVRGSGGYMVVPPSVHPSGRAYRFRGKAPQHPIAAIPKCLEDKLKDRRDTVGLAEPEEIHQLLDDLNGGTTNFGGEELVSKAVAKLENAESRHPAAVEAVVSVLRTAAEGVKIDLPDALNQLRGTLAKRTKGDKNHPADEFDDIVTWAASQIINDPPPPIAVGIGLNSAEATVDADVTKTQPLRLNDVDNSTRFINQHGDTVRYIAKWGKWLVWQNHRWVIDDRAVFVHELGKDVSRTLYLEAANASDPDTARSLAKWAGATATKGRIDSFIELARGISGVLVAHEQLDSDPWLLGVRDGIIELQTGKHRPGHPDDLMTMQAGVAYEPDATSPVWDTCLEQWFPNPEVRDYVQRLAGAALVGEQREHLLVIHFGNGANGKGTFVRALAHVLGAYFITPHKALLVESRHESHPTDRADLFRKRLAVAVETDHRQRLNEAQIKNLTGGDQISARRMREDFWTFWPSHSLWLQTNYLPEIEGTDTGIWRRLRVVEWPTTFTDETRDQHLDEKLRTEAAGILNWLLEGLHMWQEHGLDEPDAVVKATATYRASEDVLTRFAGETGLVFENGHELVVSVLTDTLKEWCEEEGITKVPPPKRVNEWMRTNGATRTKKRVEGYESPRAVWLNAGFDPQNVPTVPTAPVKHRKQPYMETNRKTGNTGDASPSRDRENPDTAMDSAQHTADGGLDQPVSDDEALANVLGAFSGAQVVADFGTPQPDWDADADKWQLPLSAEDEELRDQFAAIKSWNDGVYGRDPTP